MHWEAVPGFAEAFPDIEISDALFEVSGTRFTCAGGTAALDLMLDMIARKHGQALAVAVSEQFIHDRIRDRHDRQRMSLPRRLGIANGKLVRVIEAMEANLEAPLDGAPARRPFGRLAAPARAAVPGAAQGLAVRPLSAPAAGAGAPAPAPDRDERPGGGDGLRLFIRFLPVAILPFAFSHRAT